MSLVEMKVPVIGESVAEVTLSQWLKGNGEYVELDEPICEFESDKATLEFPAEAAGTLIYVAAEGDDLEIGALVAKIDTSASASGSTDNGTSTTAAEPSAKSANTATATEPAVKSTSTATATGQVVEMKVPVIGESVAEVTLSQWLKGDGEIIQRDEPICEFESDKATLEFPAEATGKLVHIAKEGEDLEIGALVAKIEVIEGDVNAEASSSESETSKVSPANEAKQPSNNTTYATGHPSPAAAKILKEKGIAASEVQGSGRDGRITKADAMQATPATKTTAAPEPAAKTTEKTATNAPTKATIAAFGRGEERKKMSRMRRTIAKRLVSAKNNTAMLTTFNEIDMSALMKMRKTYQEEFVAKFGIKLGFMSPFAKACAKTLLEMPDVNAFIDGDHMIYHDYADIAVAISTPNGLVVPPVRNVESLSLSEIEHAIKDLALKARDGKLSLQEMSGGTFTITNGGIFGSLMSTPILNEPQSAILGMHTIQQRPVAVNGEVQIRPMMYVALSYDHRVIDGSSAVTFLVKVKKLIEDPVKLLLNL
ncbi:MAG: 2-oxoglutarate dehydrogenase complex dihydrolipoyllysine-residue succinyltransferase [Bacteroidota bacterium]